MRLSSMVGTKIDTKYTAVKFTKRTKQVEQNILFVFIMSPRLVSFHLDSLGLLQRGVVGP